MLRICMVLLSTIFMMAPFARADTLVRKNVAEGSPWFVGLNIGETIFSIGKVYIANVSVSSRSQEDHFAMEVGREIGRSRIYGTYYLFNNYSTFHLQRFKFSFDTRLTNWFIAPYLGISTGYARYDEAGLAARNPSFSISNSDLSLKDHITISGPTYGLTLGLMYQSKPFNFRLAYGYSKLTGSDTAYFNGVRNRLKIKSIQTEHLSLSYRF